MIPSDAVNDIKSQNDDITDSQHNDIRKRNTNFKQQIVEKNKNQLGSKNINS